MSNSDNGYVSFTLGGMHFEYDEDKNRKNMVFYLKVLRVCFLIMIE